MVVTASLTFEAVRFRLLGAGFGGMRAVSLGVVVVTLGVVVVRAESGKKQPMWHENVT